MPGDQQFVSGLAAVYRCRTVAEIDRNLGALVAHLRHCPAGGPHIKKIRADIDALLDRRLIRARQQAAAPAA
jgi:hypothetical protein